MKIALQIYTLRDIINQGYDKILKEVADIGYAGVEMTYSPDKGDEVAALLKQYGLICTSAHISMNEIENNPAQAAEFLKKLGSNQMVVPWIDGKLIDTEENTIATAKKLEAGAKEAIANGFELSFHNHTIEFERKFNGRTVMDIFYDEAPS